MDERSIMKQNARYRRIITVLTIMLVLGAVTAMLARGQQGSSIRARVQVPSGPVARALTAPEAIKDLRPVVRRYAGPIVRHAKLHAWS